MNKYLQQPDEIIDLHGHTIAETESLLRDIFARKGHSHVRIIVGRGTHSKNGPVLREFVKDQCISRNIRFNQSKLQDGGEGALEVFL